MARTAAVIQADLDAINAAIGSGALSVAYTDRSITYRSIVELRNARQLLESELAGVAGTARIRSVAFMTGKGL